MTDRSTYTGRSRSRDRSDRRPTRRRLLAVTAVLPALTGCLDDFSSDDDGPGGGDDRAAGEGGDGTEQRDGPPYEIDLIDAPGSEDTTVAVPEAGQVALVNFTRQNCPTSAGHLDTIGEAYDRLSRSHDVGPNEELFVVSVIDWTTLETPSDEELADWWDDQDGHWPIGIDRSGAFFEAYLGSQYPGTAVFDATGDRSWHHDGGVGVREIVDEVETAIDGEQS